MDGWVREHLKANGAADGPLTMGYYERRDLELYFAVAEAFTLCDHYHCSVMGPTDPNRLYTFAASLDPDGSHGGPIPSTSVTRAQRVGTLTSPTMPEQLSARGISTPYPVPANSLPVQEPGTPRRPSGPVGRTAAAAGTQIGSVQAGTDTLRVTLHGVPKHCAHPRFRVRVSVKHSHALKFVHLRVNGHIARSTRGATTSASWWPTTTRTRERIESA